MTRPRLLPNEPHSHIPHTVVADREEKSKGGGRAPLMSSSGGKGRKEVKTRREPLITSLEEKKKIETGQGVNNQRGKGKGEGEDRSDSGNPQPRSPSKRRGKK